MWKTKFPRFYKTTIFKIKKNFKKYNKKVNIFQNNVSKYCFELVSDQSQVKFYRFIILKHFLKF